ncbi:hypothetical protein [Pseudorhizobium marinum]|uniref:hypothetical protein n=1 Tax=Pseudorhizobium marinum TaxID=1496690 RepID=UPI000A76FF2D|nr:hypothetical protein [Pseudorhizobium marinum]
MCFNDMARLYRVGAWSPRERSLSRIVVLDAIKRSPDGYIMEIQVKRRRELAPDMAVSVPTPV